MGSEVGDFVASILALETFSLAKDLRQAFVEDFIAALTNDEGFHIRLDRLAKWLRVLEGNLKDTLVLSYREHDDFVVHKGRLSTGGRPKDTVLLTPDCFKRFCRKSRTKHSDEFWGHFVSLEQLYREHKIRRELTSNPTHTEQEPQKPKNATQQEPHNRNLPEAKNQEQAVTPKIPIQEEPQKSRTPSQEPQNATNPTQEEQPTTRERKPRAKNIRKCIRRLVWNKYIGCNRATGKCACCEVTKISVFDFECGHVIARAKGGEDTVDNLRPICSLCNKSMGTDNLFDFKKEHGLGNK